MNGKCRRVWLHYRALGEQCSFAQTRPNGRVKELIGLSRSLRVLSFISVFLTPSVLAQTGGIQGVVLDSKNKPVNNSHVIASLAPASGAADPKGRNIHSITY